VRVGVLIALATACGRVGFDGSGDGGLARSDGAVDDAPAGLRQAYLKASNADPGDRFGASLAVSADGKTLAVGAPGESSATGDPANNDASLSGAVYVFVLIGSAWHEQAYLKAPFPDLNDNFGWSLAISSDGNTLAIGAPGEDSAGTGTTADPANNAAADAGAVFVFTRNGATWSEDAYLKATNTGAGDELGWSVALSGDGSTLAAGAPLERSAATGIDGNGTDNSLLEAGAAYVYTHSNTWQPQAYVKASNTDGNDQFGASVALSADGTQLVVGAQGEDSASAQTPADNSSTSSGALYMFTRTGTWAQAALLKSSPVTSGDFLGLAIALSPDGSTLVAGAPGEDTTLNSGAAFLFDGATQRAMLKGSPRAPDDQLGLAVATDGATIVLGAQLADSGAANTGRAYVFTRATSWSQTAALLPSPVDANDNFGASVAVGATTIAVGAPREDGTDNASPDSGAVYVWF
jgi:hypothetical protein